MTPQMAALHNHGQEEREEERVCSIIGKKSKPITAEPRGVG